MDATARRPSAPRWEPANPRSPARAARGRRRSGGCELADRRSPAAQASLAPPPAGRRRPAAHRSKRGPPLTTQRRSWRQSAEQFALGYASRPLSSRSCKLTGQPVHAAERTCGGPHAAQDPGRCRHQILRADLRRSRLARWLAGRRRPCNQAEFSSSFFRECRFRPHKEGLPMAQLQSRTLGGSRRSLRCSLRARCLMRQMRPSRRIRVQPSRPEVIRYRSAPQSGFSEALPKP